LSFERDANGSLVARQGQYRLAVESGRTTVTVGDRRRGRVATVTTRLAGAAAMARPEGEDPLAAKANYFLGDPAQWRTGAPLFRRAVERNVYSGIDLVFHGDNGSLEYDFRVRPGANPRRIILDVSGASAMHVDAGGALAIATQAGEIRWKKPEVYQWKNGVRQPVAGAFALHGRRVTFAIGEYDRSRELVIDPTLAYATYFGGSEDEGGRGLAVDSSGNIYMTGFTYSVNLPVTSGAFQTAYHGGTASSLVGGDAFVAKYTPAGALVYVTYLGGSSDDCGNAIAVDSAGNAYITGFTDSVNFPTVKGSYQTAFGGLGTSNQYSQDFGDAFVTKLNANGSALVYSTFLGGSNDDVGTAVAVDSSGNAYVGGATLSTNFPTVNPFQASFHGGGGSQPLSDLSTAPFLEVGDGFVAKLNPAGSALLFSTYFGGSLDDAVSSLALDTSDNVYVGGNTMSTDFPTLNPYQKTFGGAANADDQPVISIGDGFVAKFSSSGVLQYSTYLGGNGDDAVMGIAVDSTGAAYVTGFTSSPNFPVSANTAQKNFTGPAGITGLRGFVWGDAFVSKLAPSGSSLVWSTYLGGTQDDAGMAIALDSGLNVIVGGFANSTDFPITSNAQQPVFGGNGPAGFTDPTGDAFVAKISADGTAFDYVSYYGGNSSDAISSVVIDGQGRVIVEGATTSSNLPGTAGGAQRNFGGTDGNTSIRGDAFMAIFSGIATAPSLTPTITAVVNEASFTTALAPGSAAAIFGTGLPASASAGATVGSQAAQVVLATATEWVVVIPNNAAAGPSSVQVGTAARFSITLAQYAPALFSADASGKGAAAASAPSFPPYQPGETISIYATGLGTVGANGQPAQLPSVTIGATQVTVFSAVASSSSPGDYQITIQIPPTTPAGNPAVVLSIGGVSSQSLTLPVGAITGTTITYVENAASYLPGFSQGSWVTITGANLAGTTRIWTAADFSGDNLPTALSQVSVTIDAKPAYVYFISPTQINVLAPAESAQGPVPVQVTYAGTASNTLMATIASFSPAMFMFSPDGGRYVAAVRATDGQYIGPTSLYSGLTMPANVGDTLELYGTGFGPTNPNTDFAQTFTGAPPTTNTVTATIGGVAATVQFAGLVAPGEYQFNIVVPNVPAGDNLVVLKVNGLTTQANAYLTVN
jgi:uncharacterized protein (TIGR03437 family)